jgi:hypothetical protein
MRHTVYFWQCAKTAQRNVEGKSKFYTKSKEKFTSENFKKLQYITQVNFLELVKIKSCNYELIECTVILCSYKTGRHMKIACGY